MPQKKHRYIEAKSCKQPLIIKNKYRIHVCSGDYQCVPVFSGNSTNPKILVRSFTGMDWNRLNYRNGLLEWTLICALVYFLCILLGQSGI